MPWPKERSRDERVSGQFGLVAALAPDEARHADCLALLLSREHLI